MIKPQKLPSNQFDHFYKGGYRIGTLRKGPGGPMRPEEWIGSMTTRFGEKSMGLSVLEDGTVLRDSVIENPEKYQKTAGIYVIPDEKILILRTLIKINKLPTSNLNIFKQLDDYFIRQRTFDKSISDKNLVTLKNKRLTGELKFIEKIPDKVKVKSCSDEAEKPWLIELFVKDKIYQIEMSFNNYPLNPPYFKMVNFEEPVKGIIDKEFYIKNILTASAQTYEET